MLAQAVGKLVGGDERSYISEVPVRESLIAERSIDVCFLISVHIVYHQVHEREVTTIVTAGLILVGVSHTQRVAEFSFKESGVKFSGYGGEVLLLVVTCVLEVLCVPGLAVGGGEARVAEAGGGSGGCVDILAVHHIVTYVELVVLVDVPVHAGENLKGRLLSVVSKVLAGIVAVFGFKILGNGVHHHIGRIGNTVRAIGEHLALYVRKLAVGTYGALGKVAGRPGTDGAVGLNIEEEEQLVLDDGAAHGSAVHHVTAVDLVYGSVIGHLVALHVLVSEITVCGGEELIGTRLGYRIDAAAGKAGLPYIERSDGDCYLLERVQRDGAAAGGQVGTDTEGVVHGRAVHRHVGITVGAASDEGLGAGNECLGSLLENVVHAPGNRRHLHHLLGIKGSEGAGAVGTHVGGGAFGRHYNSLEVEGLLLEIGVDDEVVGQGYADILEHGVGIAEAGNSNHIRPAGHDVVDVVTAAGVGYSVILRAGRLVHGHHSGACDRPCGVRNFTTHGSSRNLRECRHDK